MTSVNASNLSVCIRPVDVMVNNHHRHAFPWVSLQIKVLGDGYLDPFGFYGRPMIIDPSA